MAAKKTNPTNQVAEKRVFRMHPKLLWDVITRQAGTLSKAGLELVMNSIDAGATRCDVTITPARVMVVDDGKGFLGREEIEKFFETFGQPHEEGDATYGRFRMGRGQAFAFGRSRFFSNDHLMDVDIKPQEKAVASDGLNYQLTTLDKPVKGCRVEIDLYEKLLPSQVDAMARELAKFVKFAQIPVTVNGEVVNTLPKDKKWSMETDEAFFDLKDSGTLEVYSLGVLVRAYPASQFGAGGTVVSRKTLSLNFARNDILSSCPMFKNITATVRKTAVKDSVKKKRLTGAEWEAVANEVRVGDTDLSEVFSTPLVKLVTGSMLSFADLASRIGKHHGRVAVGKPDEHMADRIMQRGVALVIDRETVERFGYGSLKEFCAGIAKLTQKAEEAMSHRNWQHIYKLRSLGTCLTEVKILEQKDFGKYVQADYDDVPVGKLNPAEKFALQLIQRASSSIGNDIQSMVRVVRDDEVYWAERFLKDFPLAACQQMEAMCGKDRVPRVREIKVGSGSADAWTDGEAVIWINRNNLRLLAKGVPGMTRIAELLFHEYLHQSPNTGNLNTHNLEFYETHHDISIDTPLIGRAVNDMMDRAIRMVRQEKRKPTGALLKFEDQMAELSGIIAQPRVPDPTAQSAENELEPEMLAARSLSM
jgi:hypothetical protein